MGKEHAIHLQQTLEQHYKVTNDWSGSRYIGITLDWDYERKQVHLSMPGYVAKALKQFQHMMLKNNQHAPFPCTKINNGAKKQYATQASTAPELDKKVNK